MSNPIIQKGPETMYKKIMVATDGSEPSTNAVKHAAGLAKLTGAGLVIVNVTESWSVLEAAQASESGIRDPVEQYEKLADNAAKKTLNAAEAVAKGTDQNKSVNFPRVNFVIPLAVEVIAI